MNLTEKKKKVVRALMVIIGLPLGVMCAMSNSIAPGALFGFIASLGIDGMIRYY